MPVLGDLRYALLSQLQADPQLALLPEAPDDAEAKAIERRGPGRPAGSANRATRQLRDFLLRNFTDPAVAMAANGLCTTPEATLQKALAIAAVAQCKVIEALHFMRMCSAEVAPYVHSKQPLAVAINGRIATLHIGLGVGVGDGGDLARSGGDAIAALLDGFGGAADALALEDLTNEENADVSMA